MKDKSQMQKKAKQLLAWILSTQITGMLPFLAVMSTVTVNVAYAGTSTIPGAPLVNPAEEKSEGLPGGGAYMQENAHGSSSNYSGNEPKKGKFCKKDDGSGKWKTGCVVAAVLLGVAAIVALVLLTRNRGRCSGACGRGGAMSGGSGGAVKPGKPGRPNNPEPTGPGERPPVVPCCNNPAPAPAPAGGGTTQSSTVTTGSAPVPGVEPIVVNP